MSNHALPSLAPELWLVQRLANTDESDPRFEASWYGLYNALLSHYFPYQRRFLVKPQPKIRETSAENEGASFSSIQAESSMVVDESSLLADFSMTSMGALAPHGGSAVVPDFVVTKATEFASHDKAFLIVEVKPREPKNESELTLQKYQMIEYMERLSEQIPEDGSLVGLLTHGTTVSVYRLERPASRVKEDEERYDVNGETIRQLLLNMAMDRWDN